MSTMVLLESILKQQKALYPSLNEDDFFEVFCADNILLNYDLSPEEIQSGIVDNSKDGGVDAAYVLVNRVLVTEDYEFSAVKQPVEIEFFIVQAKNTGSFQENPIDKLAASLPQLLDSQESKENLEGIYHASVVAAFRSFINAMETLATEFPKVSVRIFYCCKGTAPNDVMKAKATTLESTLAGKYPKISFTFLGAQELYERSGKQKRLVKELPIVGSPLPGSNNSYVALSTLKNYIKFVSEEDGGVSTRMFEANVRAYQGEVDVNKEIAHSLSQPTTGVDFWWLNNGVTIVADQTQFMSGRLTIENPLIVNGLQTSHELHKVGQSLPAGDDRMVLVRIIVETDRLRRDEIIRATNRQTNIKPSSFRATEPLHREIEDYLKTIDFYYDRRKNQYKREGKPTSKIVSIDRLAQGGLALLKQEPHVARARPTTAMKSEADYKAIFSGDKSIHPLEMYGNTIRMLSSVETHFASIATAENQIQRNNLRFHVLMVLGWALNENETLPAQRIAQLDLAKMTPAILKAVTDWVFSEFSTAGGTDKVAKDAAFTTRLKTEWTVAKTKTT